MRIKSVELIDEEVDVHDIEVEDDHSFIVKNVILHNSAKCRALDSKMFDENKNPVGHNLQMIPPSGPPLHVRCRSVLMPILKSRSDVSEEMDEILKEQTNSQREAMNGNVPANTTYDDWLKKQSVELQKEILGLKKYEIWKKNKLTMADLVDQTANPLTVKELISKWGEP
jgi:hypothetical protein